MIIVILAAISLLLSGCWDRKELNQLGIVMAIGLDRDQAANKIVLTSQVVRPASLGKQSSGGKESPYDIVITSGNTVFEAVRNTVKEFDRRSFFSHVKVIVVGESLAREGLKDVIDFVSRTHEIRRFTWLIVTNGSSARDILGVKHGIENVQATYMDGIIKRQERDSDVTTSSIIEFIQKMQGESINPTTGVFKIVEVESISSEENEPQPKEGIIISGTAAFQKDKLAGFLNEVETRGLNLITGGKTATVVNVTSPVNEEKLIAVEFKSNGNTIKPVYENGKLAFIIKTKVIGSITEVQDDAMDISDPEQFDKVNDKLKEFIHNNMDITVKKVQGDLKTDILGFGSAFERKYPKEWEKVKDDWEKIFPEVSYRIEVDASLQKSGLLQKPLTARKADK
jgi:spore germination protein KC